MKSDWYNVLNYFFFCFPWERNLGNLDVQTLVYFKLEHVRTCRTRKIEFQLLVYIYFKQCFKDSILPTKWDVEPDKRSIVYYRYIIFLYKSQTLILDFQASLYVNHQLLFSSITMFYPLVLFSIFVDRGLPYLVSKKNRDTKSKGTQGDRDRDRDRERERERNRSEDR